MEDFFSFKEMISSTIIKISYILGMIGITLAGIGYFIAALKFNPGTEAWIGYLTALGIVILGNLLWRVLCETSIIFFSIHENLVSIDKKLEKENKNVYTNFSVSPKSKVEDNIEIDSYKKNIENEPKDAKTY